VIRLGDARTMRIASWMRVPDVDAPGAPTAARALPRLF
jgi:hypothetical protein